LDRAKDHFSLCCLICLALSAVLSSSRMPTLIVAVRILSFAIMLALSGALPFIFVEGKIQSSGFA
jgi:hypothetical protein